MEKNQEISLQDYEKKSQRIIQLVDRLRDEGAHLEIDLPTVVFCGNQSAGKSSLIEAISSIKLPRSDGTCTRCPMELRLSDTPKNWECSISLQLKYDNNGIPRDDIQDIPFVSQITNMDEVEVQVRRAQKAILNPSFPHENYKYYKFDDSTLEKRVSESEKNELKFTMNTVCLKITGSYVNLTLIDLPGIIRSTETSQDSVFIKMVEGMVKKYISNTRALIIATISCKDEIENQAIIAMAKEADPEGSRTVGVLTKPDTIESDCHDTWLQVLNNSRFQLRLGYYMIKNPTKKELDSNISFEDARNNEACFFSGTSPWSSSGAQIKSRMGVNKLRNELSIQLTELIETSLPAMKSKVYELIDQISTLLNALPKPVVQNPKIEILGRIKQFSVVIKELTEARSLEKNVYHEINSHFKHFNNEIFSTRPILLLPDEQDNIPQDFNSTFIQYGEASLPSHFTSESLNNILEKQKGREFSQFIKSEALQIIISLCQKLWKENAISCLDNVEKVLKIALSQQIESCFGRFKKLEAKIKNLTEDLVQETFNNTHEKLHQLFSMELDFPATWDIKCLDHMVNYIRTQLEAPLNNKELSTFKAKEDTEIQQCLLQLSNIGINTTKDCLPQLIPNLFNERTRKIIEISQAYYHIASSRYGDMVPLTIFSNLIQYTANNIETYLIEHLKLLDDDQGLAATLLEESHIIASQRDDYTKRLKRLREVRKTLS